MRILDLAIKYHWNIKNYSFNAFHVIESVKMYAYVLQENIWFFIAKVKNNPDSVCPPSCIEPSDDLET